MVQKYLLREEVNFSVDLVSHLGSSLDMHKKRLVRAVQYTRKWSA